MAPGKNKNKRLEKEKDKSIKCPYCGKNYKTVGFWFNNHILIKHHKVFNRIFILTEIVLPLIISGLFYYGYIDQITGKNPPPVNVNETQMKEILKAGLTDILKNVSIPSNISTNTICDKNITKFTFQNKGFTLEAELYDGCDYKRLKPKVGSLPKTASMWYLVYPVWEKNDSNIHFLMDIFNDENETTKNRISLYHTDGKYLIGKFYDQNMIGYELTLDVNDWEKNEWALIGIQSEEDLGRISLIYLNVPKNRLEMKFVNVSDYKMDFKNINAYIGSDLNKRNQAYAVISNVPEDWIFENWNWRGLLVK